MTGKQPRALKPLDRVCWGATTTDLGTVIETDWAGVSINWDNGHTTSIQHNDMARVDRVPTHLVGGHCHRGCSWQASDVSSTRSFPRKSPSPDSSNTGGRDNPVTRLSSVESDRLFNRRGDHGCY